MCRSSVHGRAAASVLTTTAAGHLPLAGPLPACCCWRLTAGSSQLAAHPLKLVRRQLECPVQQRLQWGSGVCRREQQGAPAGSSSRAARSRQTQQGSPQPASFPSADLYLANHRRHSRIVPALVAPASHTTAAGTGGRTTAGCCCWERGEASTCAQGAPAAAVLAAAAVAAAAGGAAC